MKENFIIKEQNEQLGQQVNKLQQDYQMVQVELGNQIENVKQRFKEETEEK